jgi:hypothetical protein
VTSLKNKIQDALDESRMLILGAEILLGFQFTAYFQDGFTRLPAIAKVANTCGLASMLLAVALMIAPSAFHQIAAEGEDRPNVHKFATLTMDAALFPFALGLGLTLYIPAEQTVGGVAAGVCALTAIILSGTLWYGLPLLGATNRRKPRTSSPEERGTTTIHDRIRQALTETRVILPGNQALLGFQFAVILQRAFADLAFWLRWVHLASLLLITVSTILLVTPAAFHRVAEQGEETIRFYRVAHLMVLLSLPPLSLGICGDFFIVMFKISNHVGFSLLAAVIMALLFLSLWLVYPLLHRGAGPHNFQEKS